MLDPIHRRIYGNDENNSFDSFVYTNKQHSSFFQPFTNQTYKEIQNKINSKPKVLSNTMIRISRIRTTDIHRKSERLGQ